MADVSTASTVGWVKQKTPLKTGGQFDLVTGTYTMIYYTSECVMLLLNDVSANKHLDVKFEINTSFHYTYPIKYLHHILHKVVRHS